MRELEDICIIEGEILKDSYIIKEVVAVSGLSIIYLGYDMKTQKKFIIKEYFPNKIVLRDVDKKTVLCKMPSMKGKYYNSLELFFNEATILKTFSHVNISRHVDHFLENNTGYIVTNYYEGLTLDEYMKEEIEISIHDFLGKIYLPIMNAVIAMHDKGILHRDIKPNNIMICENDVPVLIDLGSAINFRECGRKKIFVTPGFSPLEFYSEKSKQGKFSDIYGLTATLYYYLCGIIPEDSGKRVIEDNMENIRKYNDQITLLFSKIIMKNLSISHKNRMSSLRLFKLFVYLEYLILKLKDRISDVREEN